jgi:hypothetical protein
MTTVYIFWAVFTHFIAGDKQAFILLFLRLCTYKVAGFNHMTHMLTSGDNTAL